MARMKQQATKKAQPQQQHQQQQQQAKPQHDERAKEKSVGKKQRKARGMGAEKKMFLEFARRELSALVKRLEPVAGHMFKADTQEIRLIPYLAQHFKRDYKYGRCMHNHGGGGWLDGFDICVGRHKRVICDQPELTVWRDPLTQQLVTHYNERTWLIDAFALDAGPNDDDDDRTKRTSEGAALDGSVRPTKRRATDRARAAAATTTTTTTTVPMGTPGQTLVHMTQLTTMGYADGTLTHKMRTLFPVSEKRPT